jgi:translation initiation factor IF-2
MLKNKYALIRKRLQKKSILILGSQKENNASGLLLLTNPLRIALNDDSDEIGNDDKFKLLEKNREFPITLAEKPNNKLERKHKKNERDDDRENENGKSKIRSKKKIRANIEVDDDYNNIKEDTYSNSQSDAISLSLARPVKNTNQDKGSDTKKINFKNTAKTGTSKKNKKNNLNKKDLEEVKTTPEQIIIPGPVSVQELAQFLYISETEIIRSLFLKGIGVTINQILDVNTAKTVGEELGVLVTVEQREEEEEKRISSNNSANIDQLIEKPPIVAVMGHVDHGKTTLLDKLRQTQIAQKEAGGITQRIGAYEVNVDHKNTTKKLVFLDTPGHEAFSGMRSRGIRVTDIGVLVVAADDGVKEQTVEIVKSIQKANIPLIVAINKIDKENADIEKIKQELTQYNVIPESWGGDVQTVAISASQGTNIDQLLETILLVAELENLKANPEEKAQGTILEANLDRTKGAVATLLVQNGTLKVGDIIVAGAAVGKIRGMVNSNGETIEDCGPASPVLIWGLSEVPITGDYFEVYPNEKEAKLAAELEKDRQTLSTTISEGYTISNSETLGTINLIIKTDIHGSVEAIVNTINKIPQNKVQIRMIYTSPGEVTETDIDFADTSGAKILAFNTTLASGARRAARHLNVSVKEYDVIYDLFEDVELMIEEITGPEYEEEIIGEAIVKTVFPLGKSFVAGCYLEEGKIKKSSSIEVIRNSETIYKGPISSLKQFKQDVGEILVGNECGIFVEDFNEWKEQDIIKALNLTPKKRG